jgi:gamma-glutamyltranspeptidase/glutathione hydrolase
MNLSRLIIVFLLFCSPAAALARGGVVSSADPRATEAGREILEKGGSATDAALAMMLALTVVEPQSSGIGGGGFLIRHDGASGAIESIDGRETAPASASPRLFVAASGKPIDFSSAFPGGRSVGVPGNIRLMEEAHRRWGRLSWAALFEPAIRLADKGYVVNETLAAALSKTPPLWKDFPEARAIYWENDRPKPNGATVRNPALARLLRDVAARGPDAFYSGRHGRAIIAAVERTRVHPAVLSQADLSAYRVKTRDVVCAPYRRFKVCGMGPPSSGATTILQILGLIERFDIKAMGKDDPRAWHLIAEAMLLAYADREKYLGDPDYVDVPVTGLIDRRYLAERSSLISPDTSLASYEAGSPPGAEPRTPAVSGEVAGTTHFVAVDGAGDIVTMTSTIEGAFGSQLVASGVFLNNELTDFTFAPEKNGAPVANRVEAGKRPLSSMSPTIVYDDKGRPVLALGSAGGKRIIMHVAKTLVGYMDWDLSAADAIALPNIFFDEGSIIVEAGTGLAAKLQELNALGRPAVAAALHSKVNAVEATARGWRGAADPRSEGIALSDDMPQAY